MNWMTRLLWSTGRAAPATWDEWMAEARAHSGFMRQAAVEALAHSGHGAALPLLLERANDWVPQVRDAACKAVRAFLVDEHLGHWAIALGHVAALQRQHRADHSALLRDVEAFLCRPDHLAALGAARPTMPRSAARFLLQMELRAARTDDAARAQVLRRAVLDADVAVASNAAAAIAALAPPEVRIGVAGTACRSRFAAVRMAGLRALQPSRAPAVQDLVQRMCHDASAGVRALALSALGGGREQVLDEARSAWRSHPAAGRRAVALNLLCDLEPATAPALCRQALEEPAAVLRRAAYARLLRLARGDERDHWVLLALQDQSPRVRRLAVMEVEKGAAAPGVEALRQILQAHSPALASLVAVATHLSPWPRLEFLLQALRDANGAALATHQLHCELERWAGDTRRSFVQPSLEQVQTVRRCWGAMRDALPAEVGQQVAFQLRTFRILV